ncbi:DUF2065 family protein [Jiella sp. MQZ9-1]|uniref:DUF2065 family protein n=1 Tax=Jiella flava TaxID=2816857 RepID=A0A939FVQ3_9HYPH|nr:DUF2065 family protein [Jiella flava]MBO0661734.1 DUF2065 family protein [Jiella flava]MCD2470375.1 DUF2065 family protein [Jiella flava]
MIDFFDALGLLLVIEGIVYCLFPTLVKRIATQATYASIERLRLGGLGAAIAGLCIIWAVRG